MKKYMLFMSLLMALGLIASEDSSSDDYVVKQDAVVENDGSDSDSEEDAPLPPPRKKRPKSVVQKKEEYYEGDPESDEYNPNFDAKAKEELDKFYSDEAYNRAIQYVLGDSNAIYDEYEDRLTDEQLMQIGVALLGMGEEDYEGDPESDDEFDYGDSDEYNPNVENELSGNNEETQPPVPPRKRKVQINSSNDVNGGGGSAVDDEESISDNRLVSFLLELFEGSPDLKNSSEFIDFQNKSGNEQAEILVVYAENNKLEKKQLQDLVGILMRKQLKIEFAKKIDLIQRLCKLNFDGQLFNKIENWLKDFEYHDNFTASRDQKDIAIPKSVSEWKSALISFYNLNLKIFTNKLEIEKNALDGLQNQLNALPLGEEPADLDSAEGKVYKTAQKFHEKTQESINSKSEEVQYLNDVINELTVNIEKLSQEQSVAEQSETIDNYRDTENPVVVCLIAAFDKDNDIDMSGIVTFLKKLNLKSNNYEQWGKLIDFSEEQKNKYLDAMIDACLLDSTTNGGLSENEVIMLRYELYKLVVKGLETVLQKLETGDKFTGDEKEAKRVELAQMLEEAKATFQDLEAKYPSRIKRLGGWLFGSGGGKK